MSSLPLINLLDNYILNEKELGHHYKSKLLTQVRDEILKTENLNSQYKEAQLIISNLITENQSLKYQLDKIYEAHIRPTGQGSIKTKTNP